jgi:nucleotide-binding universal stress UspA family protein
MPTILACTDGSFYATSIYEHASWAASQLGASVHLLHVIERDEVPAMRDHSGNLGFTASSELIEEIATLEESHARVARLRGKAILEDAEKKFSGITVQSTQRHGPVVDTVTEFEKESDLVILGKRGEHVNFAKGHLGSNLERVVRTAKIPVLVAAREFKPVTEFTVAFDGGASSMKAIHYLCTNNLLKGAKCHLLSIGKEGSDLARDLENSATALRGAGYEVDAQLLSGDPDEVIAAKVKDSGSDLLVMGAYGHSRVRQFILGSTTTNLVRTCHIPVLLFR